MSELRPGKTFTRSSSHSWEQSSNKLQDPFRRVSATGSMIDEVEGGALDELGGGTRGCFDCERTRPR